MTSGRPEQNVYASDFFEGHLAESLGSARAVVPILIDLLHPRNVVDVGCGIGTWLAAFRELGIEDVLGIDGNYVDRSKLLIPEACFLPSNLEKPLELGRKFDMVISLEVAEHLPESAARTFVESLTSLGEVVVFSAAIPQQGGTFHLNEQWPDYWRDHFRAAGYDMIDCLRRRLWDDEKISSSYRQNSFVYIDSRARNKYDHIYRESTDLPLRLVHPGVFAYGLYRLARQRPTLRPLLRALPWALKIAICGRLGIGGHR